MGDTATPHPNVNLETSYPQNNSSPWFSLDDIPILQWDDKFKEFVAWIDN